MFPVSQHAKRQRGGITILVVLSLLVLLTAAAIGLSKNSLREVMIVGSAREGAIVRNTADAGIEFSFAWMNLASQSTSGTQGGELQKVMRAIQDQTKAPGVLYAIPVTADNTITAGGSSTPANYALSMMFMGPMGTKGTSQTGQQPADEGLLLWDLRSQGTLSVGSQSFIHTREAFLTTPITNN